MNEIRRKNTWDDDTYIYNGGKVFRRDKKKMKHVIVGDHVTKIADQAFERCKFLRTVKISASSCLQEIGNRSFFECLLLDSVTLPPTLNKIGKKAFCRCDWLSSTSLLDSNPSQPASKPQQLPAIRIIEKKAFLGCDSLTSVVLPASVERLGGLAFAACFNLRSFKISNDSPIRIIPPYCFTACTGLSTVVLSDKIKVLSTFSFANCDELSTIKLPKSLEVVESGTFSWCGGLTSIELPPSVEEIGSDAFLRCGLRTVKLPDQIRTIEKETFSNCRDLQSVELPRSIKVIHDDAFFPCNNLTTIDFSTSSSVATAETSARDDDKCLYTRQNKTATIRLPIGIEYIAASAFEGCSHFDGLIDVEKIHYLSDIDRAHRFLRSCNDYPAALRPFMLRKRKSFRLKNKKKRRHKSENEEEEKKIQIRHSSYVFYLLVQDGTMWKQQEQEQIT